MTEETLFELLLRTPEAERPALLDQACEGNPELRARVEALLKADAAASPLSKQSPALERTAGFNHTTEQAELDLVGSIIDRRFKLQQKLGEGGMGTVWVAEQEQPVKRRVALKLIKAGMDSAQVIRRFEAERQALALMDHTNIAKVLDAGTAANGRPYFVMELVKGVPITKYCDEVHASIKNRLELFIQVCSAVQHAHQKGIIHRDIKPSNILVAMQDGKPVPKVIDFGVAKALHSKLADQTMYTEIGQIIGTLEYMAPEQAELSAMDIDTRADIYALGVLLYELLTGSTPITRERMKSAAFAEVLRLIKEEEPQKPSTRLSDSKASLATLATLRKTDPKHLSSELKGELDWVVLKALEKDRTCRYETANGIARDIQRYLADEVVEARPPSAGYRFRKFVRRNKGQVIAAGLVFVTLLAGVVGTTFGLLEARRQASIAREQQVEAKKQETMALAAANEERQAKLREAQRAEGEKQAKLEAEKNLKQAQENLAFANKGNEILGSVFAGLDPKANYATLGEFSQALKNNLTKAVKELEGSAIGDPLAVAEMQSTLGLSLLGLGDPKQAILLFEKARATCTAQLGADHPKTLTSMNNLAGGYEVFGKLDKALRLYEETLRLQTAKLGANHVSTLTSMNNLAAGYQNAGKLDKALPLLEETLKLRKAKLGPDHLHTLGSMNNLAVAYGIAGKLDKALPLLEETLKLFAAKLGVDHPDTLTSMNNLAEGCQAAGKLDKALPLYEETLKLRKAKLGADHPDTLTSMNNLAEGYHAAGKLDKALPLYEETIKLRRAKLGADHPDTLVSLGNMANGYMEAGKLDKALPLYEETLKLRRVKLGADHPFTLVSMGSLAECYRVNGNKDKALPLFEESLKLQTAILGANHPDTLNNMGNLALCYNDLGHQDKALSLLEKTLELKTDKLGDDHPHTLRAMGSLARAYLNASKFDQALPLFEKTLKLQTAKLGANHPDTLGSMNNLILAYSTIGEKDKAIALLAEVRKRLPQDSPQLAMPLAAVGLLMLKAKAFTEAEPLLRECLAISEKSHPDAWNTFNAKSMLGEALMGQKKYTDAEPLLIQGYEGMKQHEKTIPPQANTRLPEALDHLIHLYTETNKLEEVKKWQAEKDKLLKAPSNK